MNIDLTDRVAIVTGGSRGIGYSIARTIVEAGGSVMLASRKEADLQAAVASLPGDRSAYHAGNAGDQDAAEACVRETVDRFGRVDMLVNNAATNPYYGEMMGIDASRFGKILDVNLKGPLLWAQAVWNAYMSEYGGVILNIASVGAFNTAPGVGAYNSSKAGLLQMTRQMAVELAPRVRVVGIAPGLVETDMAKAAIEARRADVEAATPLGRIGQPEDISALAVFLLSDHASWITGQTIVVDGGSICVKR